MKSKFELSSVIAACLLTSFGLLIGGVLGEATAVTFFGVIAVIASIFITKKAIASTCPHCQKCFADYLGKRVSSVIETIRYDEPEKATVKEDDGKTREVTKYREEVLRSDTLCRLWRCMDCGCEFVSK